MSASRSEAEVACPERRRRGRDGRDEGSIMLAMIGILILTSVVTVGLASVLKGQAQTRHDEAFAQALSGAETGLDSLVARTRSAPTSTSQSPITGTNTTIGAG
jgi:hypothetical protein